MSLKLLSLILFIATFTLLQGQTVDLNRTTDVPLTSSTVTLVNDFLNSYDIVPAAGMEQLDETTERSEIIEELLDYAESFLGTGYRRGGKTPNGFDCSGFTGYVFKEFGYNLNSDSRSQFLQGEIIENTGEAEPGDLVFFSGSRGGTTIGHVGIVVESHPLTGELLFIHSAVGGGIKIDSSFAPYYANRFKGLRRIIK